VRVTLAQKVGAFGAVRAGGGVTLRQHDLGAGLERSTVRRAADDVERPSLVHDLGAPEVLVDAKLGVAEPSDEVVSSGTVRFERRETAHRGTDESTGEKRRDDDRRRERQERCEARGNEHSEEFAHDEPDTPEQKEIDRQEETERNAPDPERGPPSFDRRRRPDVMFDRPVGVGVRLGVEIDIRVGIDACVAYRVAAAEERPEPEGGAERDRSKVNPNEDRKRAHARFPFQLPCPLAHHWEFQGERGESDADSCTLHLQNTAYGVFYARANMKRSEDPVARVLGNPFTGAANEWQQAAERVLSFEDSLPTSLGTQSDADSALRRIVARTLAEVVVRGRKVGDVLGVNRVPERWFTRVRSSRGDAMRWVAAAARCQTTLGALAGVSESLKEVRASAWNASFGASLSTSVRLERVIREHDVLIVGETGTGKEAVAHAIARGTPRTSDPGEAPFAALNIAAIPETLIESELFGHVKGAFTGAGKTRVGHIRSVASGCLFLDEVGDLPLTAQSKLLRVMETDHVTPLGSDVSYDADVRYIAATHKDLRQMVERGTFRDDLYERLAGEVIRLPPLRERPEDLAPIGERFCERYLDGSAPEWRLVRRFLASAEAKAHGWPGNVRELQNRLRSVLLGIDPGLHAPAEPTRPSAPELPRAVREARATLSETEEWYVERVLEKSAKNYALAARVLGIDRSTVRRKARAAERDR
jgi:transcriptional regulator with AAA-type ATPase domain